MTAVSVQWHAPFDCPGSTNMANQSFSWLRKEAAARGIDAEAIISGTKRVGRGNIVHSQRMALVDAIQDHIRSRNK